MKKIFLLLSALAATLSVAVAQSDDAVLITGSDGRDMVTIEPDQSGDVFIKVGGYAISFKDGSYERERPKRRSQFGREVDGKMALIEFGASMLTSPDYSAYAAADGEFLTLNASKSIHFAINCVTTSISLSRRGHLRVSTALAAVWDNFVISNKITLANAGGTVMPITIDGAKKSKLTTGSLRIPVFLELDLSRNSFVSAGVYGEWTTAWTKYKNPKTRNDEINNSINQLRWGVAAKLGITDGLYFYGDYSFTPLFRTDRGPETNPLSVGIGWLF